jgi:CheY-like chemotaxis protein
MGQSRAVLIVDDDAELRSLMATLLEDGQLDIIECESAEQRLQLCSSAARTVTARGLELRNVIAKYPCERSHGFPGIQRNSGHRDYSRLSCCVMDMQLGLD